MDKSFDEWNLVKKKINFQPKKVYYHPREVWWCSLGINIGSEQDGTGQNYDRPVLILKGFNRDSLLVIPMTGKRKIGKYYFYIGRISDRESSAIFSQIRLIDSKRLLRKMGMIDKATFAKIKTALVAALFE